VTGVLVIGGGFGGIEAALTAASLLKDRVDVTLVDKGTRHCFMPSIHEVLSGKQSPGDISFALDAVLGTARVGFVQDVALSVDTKKRKVAARGGSLSYDYLVLAAGAENTFRGVPGARAHARPFRNAEDAETIHEDLRRLAEDYAPGTSVVVVGGGTEGVEVVGELIDFFGEEGLSQEVEEGRLSIHLVHAGPRLLPGLPVRAAERAAEYLGGKGVRLHTRNPIVEAGEDRVILKNGTKVKSSLLIWTGGIHPAPLMREIPLPRGPEGWLKVTETLQSPSDERVFAVGDGVSIETPSGPLALERLAYHAIDQGRLAAENIHAHLEGKEPQAYSPSKKPHLVSMGSETGIFVQGDSVLSGDWVVGLKRTIQTRHLMTYLTRPALMRIPGGTLGCLIGKLLS
jgi:NADH dehydrogenase